MTRAGNQSPDIEAHGGRLCVFPNQDTGTTLQFTLPAGA
jgi:signal transduction histidine kinase